MAVIEITQTPRATLRKNEAIEYVGHQDLFETLVTDYGLRPVMQKTTLILYRIDAIDAALRECELAANN